MKNLIELGRKLIGTTTIIVTVAMEKKPIICPADSTILCFYKYVTKPPVTIAVSKVEINEVLSSPKKLKIVKPNAIIPTKIDEKAVKKTT